ncbi:alpha/beta fold hydrolase [Kiloniella laminariae]|uniref:alpha/beta fold hydrolase n=1 Tax=Kiloniella laminariae TaxID=454162 RepID=UPI000374B4DA|nr:alpha/beta fold hydrolase [Kiloniella laminariae]
MDTEQDLDFKPTYDWCVRAFSLMKRRLGINIKLHDENGDFPGGDIYLFNHFARFETIIPQYLIHEATGGYCRCVASGELFEGNENFAKFLYGVGAVPHNHPRLLPFLAAEIMRGHKVIIFPEGGMIKDKQVVGPGGELSIFSPTAQKRRKHHTGAAILALTVELFKQRVLSVFEKGEHDRLERWARALNIKSTEALLAVAGKPTEIIPANITFYPIRASDNILSRSAEFLSKGNHPRMVEEVLIEANILLKDCDMDIRVSRPLEVQQVWRWWEKIMLSRLFSQINSLDDFFSLNATADTLNERMFKMCTSRGTNRLRDYYMEAIYAGVTVNLHHLASALIRELVQKGQLRVGKKLFHQALYLSIKRCQKDDEVHLHRSLTKPENYWNLWDGDSCPVLDKFFASEGCVEHLTFEGEDYGFSASVMDTRSFNRVRLENLILVYANEVTPIDHAITHVKEALDDAETVSLERMALLLFDDELLSLDCDRKTFSKEQYRETNAKETAFAKPEPFLIIPDKPKKIGVLLVHGLLASPAEMDDFGKELAEKRFPVMGLRLKGHGTSPWDLRDRHWQDWSASVSRGREILSSFVDEIVIVGFATGGSLSLYEAATHPQNVAGVVAISVPWKFKTRNLVLAHLAQGFERLASWVPKLEEKAIFRSHPAEHPNVNYQNVPVRTAYELHQLRQQLLTRLPDVDCPVRLLQGTDDPIVDARGINSVFELIGATAKELKMVPSKRHGILYENIGGCRAEIVSFLTELEAVRNEGLSKDEGESLGGALLSRLKKESEAV